MKGNESEAFSCGVHGPRRRQYGTKPVPPGFVGTYRIFPCRRHPNHGTRLPEDKNKQVKNVVAILSRFATHPTEDADTACIL